jgi:hypothetical protein
MSLTTKWDGSILTPPNKANERTAMLGTFLSAKKVETYYPLPTSYADLVQISYLYKVPAKFAGRPDLIASEVYQSADLWWVILWANGVIDPFARPYAGDVIKVVDINSMKTLMK